MNRKLWIIAGAVGAGALVAYLWKHHAASPSAATSTADATSYNPYAGLPVQGEHETLNGHNVVGPYGLTWS